jgi:hypothetical protein
VRLTVNSGWGVLGQYGLSEVRFLYIPAQARQPQPADGATGIDPATSLSWRAGREAASHEVYLGTDSGDLPLADTVSAANYAPGDLEFGRTYYWQVVEVNEADAVPAWAGDVWSFSTLEYALIDGFETYSDDIDAKTTIFDTWLDGWVNGTGSTVGYLDAPFAERTIVRSGVQSMPLQYDNSVAPFYSEAEREFETTQDWMRNGADTLVLYVQGDASNSAEPMYVRIEDSSGKSASAVNGDGAVTQSPTWQEWAIPYSDLSAVNLSRVRKMVIGVGSATAPAAGGTGTVYIDDIGYGRPAAQ